MNRIVKEHYPAEKLPEDLREGLPPGAQVTVTIEVLRGQPSRDDTASFADALMRRPERVMTLEEMFAMRRTVFHSLEELNEHIRAIRDEWD